MRSAAFKHRIKRFVPDSLISARDRRRALARVRSDFRLDTQRYLGAAGPRESVELALTPVQLEAQLTRDYHRVEKGLALANPKRPFGVEVLRRLETLIPVAERQAPDAPYLHAAKSARTALARWNDGGEADSEVAPISGGPARDGDIAQFFASRHSVRDFSSEPVPVDEIQRAIRLASYSPSVCNREPWRVRLFFGADVQRVLTYQNGNRGFADVVPALALVSVELGHFTGSGERNQAWIEGGIFSSSLVWALHGIGLDSCMLNLSITNVVADQLRAAANMPSSEVPIMMIAIGHGRAGHRVARSPRRAVEDLIIQTTSSDQSGK